MAHTEMIGRGRELFTRAVRKGQTQKDCIARGKISP